jgi:hypothetical protein
MTATGIGVMRLASSVARCPCARKFAGGRLTSALKVQSIPHELHTAVRKKCQRRSHEMLFVAKGTGRHVYA